MSTDDITSSYQCKRFSEPADHQARLVVLYSPDGQFVGEKFVASPGGIVLGRRVSSRGVEIPDKRLSRVHMRVSFNGTNREWRLLDCDSSNGTYLNAQRIHSAHLQDNDVIRVGDTILLFLERAPRQLNDKIIERVARADISVLLDGETGAGKEVLAQRIHGESGRTGPFVPVNCGALPRDLLEAELFGHSRGAFSGAERARKGLFLTASEGTLFLDEIGEMPAALQPTLLRVLQERRVRSVGSDHEVTCTCRIVAATNRNLEEEAARGRFRPDLYARLAQVRLEIPALRERRWEILPLLDEFLGEHEARIPATSAEALLTWSWPYNVRELQTLAKAFSVLCLPGEELDAHFLKSNASTLYKSYREKAAGRPTIGQPPEQGSEIRGPLYRLLLEHEGNVTQVAKVMGKKRNQIYRWMRALGLSADEFRPAGDVDSREGSGL